MTDDLEAPRRSRLSVIVPATNRPRTLRRCVAAIHAATAAPEECILVTDPPGSSPAAARNAGALAASGDILVFVDADIEVHPDAFTRIRELFESDPALTAAFGAYDDSPAAHGLVSDFRNLLHHHVHAVSAGGVSTFWAGLGAVRRHEFGALGGFDARRYPDASIEDIELGLRLTRAGHRIELDPRIRGKHLKRWSLGGMLATDLLKRGIPWTRLLLATRTTSSDLNLGWRQRASSLAVVGGLVALPLRRLRSAAAAGAALIVLNRRFCGFLLRRRGPAFAAAGLCLQGLHYLVCAVSVPAGVVLHVREALISRARRRHSPRAARSRDDRVRAAPDGAGGDIVEAGGCHEPRELAPAVEAYVAGLEAP